MNARLGWLCVVFAFVACSDGDARVQQLESEVREQASRQERFEASVAASLERIASRVDAMVLELAATAGVEVPATKPPEVVAPPADDLRENVPPAMSSREIAELVASRHRPWMWVVVLAACTAAGVLGLRWWRRLPRSRHETGGDAWREAAVLTDAVVPRQPSSESPVRAALPDFELDDEVFVLDPGDELGLDPAPIPAAAAEPAAPTPPAPSNVEVPREPPRWSFQLEAADPVLARAAIAAYLRHDPRVLQRPAPVVRDHPSGLAVECALLPGLVAGEREHLRATLQRLVAVR